MFRFTPVVKNLLIANVVIFILGYLLYSQTGLDVNRFLALHYFESPLFQPWQFVTYMFLHAGINHIFGNMIGLIVFGTWLEDIWGPKRFFQYYIITGIGAGILFMGVDYIEKSSIKSDIEEWQADPNPTDFELLVVDHFQIYYQRDPVYAEIEERYYENPDNPQIERQAAAYLNNLYNRSLNVPMLGASGAIFGILLAAGLLFPYRRIMLLIPPIPMRARILVILYGAYTVYAAFQRSPDDSVAHIAHLGGMVVGYVLLKIWNEDQNRYQ